MKARTATDSETRLSAPAAAEAPGSKPEWVDYAAELNVARNPMLRSLYAALGGICVALAVIGAFVPGLPTTVWLLIAAFLFSRSSPRFYNAVLNHRVFGPIVRDYRAGNGIPRRIKFVAIACIVLFAGVSAFVLIDNPHVRIAVVGSAMFGIGFLAGAPTREPYAFDA